MVEKWERVYTYRVTMNCPSCDSEIEYTHSHNHRGARLHHHICKGCAKAFDYKDRYPRIDYMAEDQDAKKEIVPFPPEQD